MASALLSTYLRSVHGIQSKHLVICILIVCGCPDLSKVMEMCIRDRNGSETYTYQGKIAGSFVSADTYLVIPEGVYRSMNPRGTAYGYLLSLIHIWFQKFNR